MWPSTFLSPWHSSHIYNSCCLCTKPWCRQRTPTGGRVHLFCLPAYVCLSVHFSVCSSNGCSSLWACVLTVCIVAILQLWTLCHAVYIGLLPPTPIHAPTHTQSLLSLPYLHRDGGVLSLPHYPPSQLRTRRPPYV